jgi:hypothetical protein
VLVRLSMCRSVRLGLVGLEGNRYRPSVLISSAAACSLICGSSDDATSPLNIACSNLIGYSQAFRLCNRLVSETLRIRSRSRYRHPSVALRTDAQFARNHSRTCDQYGSICATHEWHCTPSVSAQALSQTVEKVRFRATLCRSTQSPWRSAIWPLVDARPFSNKTCSSCYNTCHPLIGQAGRIW